ncbi:hypothetical protein GCM10018793_34860 [Streptomyces sulfonofaciens]|uniref:DUF2267 domain-containing protein n=1 Tax=Streptomyces sulfonofaciens TaxID=68272 RepID=A0A919G8V9_9ACTN|nr:DUF2267 domain-containing protein [Streptomyces sulfonofaciens]GHH80213.1 hypothetical protein GCM10018793_34860 [Streptomyces sulfonofaciens]
MSRRALVQRIRTSGGFGGDEEAERVLNAVLAVLGGHVIGEERCELARLLPTGAAELFAGQIPLTQPLTAPGFVAAVATRLNLPQPAARWATGTVLTVLAEQAGEALTRRILACLPRGYALLFGVADLNAARAAAEHTAAPAKAVLPRPAGAPREAYAVGAGRRTPVAAGAHGA